MQKVVSVFFLALVALAGNALAQNFNLIQTFPNPTPENLDRFGNAVAAVGNKILVGASSDNTKATDAGAVYLFDSTSPDPILVIENPNEPVDAASDLFGAAVAAFGNDILVGAPGVNGNVGAVYLFNGSTGVCMDTIPNPSPTADRFGFAVAAVGNKILVGAPFNDVNATDAGVAYLFDANGTQLFTFRRRNSPFLSSGTADLFGSAVAAVGNNVLIGVPGADTLATNAGAAYLYDGNTGARLRAFANPSPTLSDQFGSTVAGVGANALIGAILGDTPSTNDNIGAAYLYDVNITAPISTFLNPTSGTDFFSFSIAAFGNSVLAVIGAPLDAGVGASYLYDVNNTTPLQPFPHPFPASGDQFGAAVAAGGDHIIIAAPLKDTGATDAGVVYLYSSNQNQPPVADAGADQTVECTSHSGTLVTLDGSNSSDPDQDQLTYTWLVNGNTIAGQTINVTLALGVHTIELTVEDDDGVTNTDAVVIEVVDTTPPTITLNGDDSMTLECHIDSYSEPGAVASDACDPSVLPPNISGSVNSDVVGTYIITYTATDAHGNDDSATRTVNVVDTTPPVIALQPAIALWPPNHKYNTISLSQCVASVSDACAGSISLSAVKIVSVSSDEPEDAPDGVCLINDPLHVCFNGDGSTKNDIVIAGDCKSVQLRKERAGSGNGRVYTINLEASDAEGNVATAAFIVSVPHDQGSGSVAVENVPYYTVASNCAASTKMADSDRDDIAEPVLPKGFALSQNYPNPFNPETEIRFALPEASRVTVKIFNTLGETIRTLADKDFAAGSHAVRWNAQNERGEIVPSGMYFYQLVTPSFTETKRMILAK